MNFATSSAQQQTERHGGGGHITITNAANNGGGLIRITAASHGFSTGNKVTITGIVGTVEANAPGWTVTNIDASNFDLQNSTFTNAYVRGGLAALQ